MFLEQAKEPVYFPKNAVKFDTSLSTKEEIINEIELLF